MRLAVVHNGMVRRLIPSSDHSEGVQKPLFFSENGPTKPCGPFAGPPRGGPPPYCGIRFSFLRGLRGPALLALPFAGCAQAFPVSPATGPAPWVPSPPRLTIPARPEDRARPRPTLRPKTRRVCLSSSPPHRQRVPAPTAGPGLFAGRRLPGGQRLLGAWHQSGQALPLGLARGTAPAARPQTPKGPFPYKAGDVTFMSLRAAPRWPTPAAEGRTPTVVFALRFKMRGRFGRIQ